MILIDLQKVFCIANNEIVLGKLHAIGFSDKTTTWSKSYLTNRAFNVNLNKHFSGLSKFLWFSSRIYFKVSSFFPLC